MHVSVPWCYRKVSARPGLMRRFLGAGPTHPAPSPCRSALDPQVSASADPVAAGQGWCVRFSSAPDHACACLPSRVGPQVSASADPVAALGPGGSAAGLSLLGAARDRDRDGEALPLSRPGGPHSAGGAGPGEAAGWQQVRGTEASNGIVLIYSLRALQGHSR